MRLVFDKYFLSKFREYFDRYSFLSQSIKSKAILKPKDARFKVPTSATGEKRKQSEFLDPEEKRPKFIIIGSTKCSTSALLRNAFELDL